MSCELAPRSSRVGRAWVRSASRRLWMYPLGCLSAPSDLCSHLREPLLCSAFVSRVCVCHRSERMDDGVWSFLCMFFSIQVSAVRLRVSQSGLRGGRGVFPQPGAAVRYDRFYHLRRPSCQHLNRGNLLSCVVPASPGYRPTATRIVIALPRADRESTLVTAPDCTLRPAESQLNRGLLCRTTIPPSIFGSGRAERRGTPCTLGETDPESEYSVHEYLW